MSIQDKELQSRIDAGGFRFSDAATLPVLFGTRVIQNPRVVWAKTADLGDTDSKDYPASYRNNRFAAVAALCYGKIDSVPSIYVNGQRLHARATDFVYEEPFFNYGEFKDTEFFGESGELSGQCAISRGKEDETKLFEQIEPFPSTPIRTPANRNVQYNGIATAALYVDVNASTSFNNWSFLTARFDSNWYHEKEKINIGRHERYAQAGGDTQTRHIVLAIDCSPINAIAIEQDGPELKYRYDLIREQAVKTIIGYIDVLKSSPVSYLWSLEVILLKEADTELDISGGRIRYNGPKTQVFPVEFEFTTSNTYYENESYYTMRSDDIAGSTIYLTTLANAVQFHPFLKEVNIEDTQEFKQSFQAIMQQDYVRFKDLFQLAPLHTGEKITRTKMNKAVERVKPAPINLNYYTQEVHEQPILMLHSEQTRSPGQYSGLYSYGKRFTPCDWSAAFEYIENHRSKDMSFNSETLGQLSILSGPTWPYCYGGWYTNVYDRRTDLGGGRKALTRGYFNNIPSEKCSFVMLSDLYKLDRYRQDYSSSQQYKILRFTSDLFPAFNYYPRPSCYNAYRNMLLALGGTGTGKDADNFRTDLCIFDPLYFNNVNRQKMNAAPFDHIQSGGLSIPVYAQQNIAGRPQRYNSQQAAITPASRRTGGAAPLMANKLGDVQPEDSYTENDFLAHAKDQFLPPRNSFNINTLSAAKYGVTSGVTDDNANSYLLAGMAASKSEVTPIIKRQLTFGLNPIHIIYQCYTNPNWGKGKFATQLDDASFRKAANQLWEERLALCFVWDRQTTLNKFVNEVLRHIDAVIYEKNNKVFIRLIGMQVPERVNHPYSADRENPGFLDTINRNPTAMSNEEYTKAQGYVFNENNISAVNNFKIPREDELINTVVVEYTRYDAISSDAQPAVHEGLVKRYGTKSQTISYPGAPTAFIAGKLARRDLMELSSPLISCEIDVHRSFTQDLYVGDVIKLGWKKYNIEEAYMRVMNVIRGDGRNNSVRLRLLQISCGDIEVR